MGLGLGVGHQCSGDNPRGIEYAHACGELSTGAGLRGIEPACAPPRGIEYARLPGVRRKTISAFFKKCLAKRTIAVKIMLGGSLLRLATANFGQAPNRRELPMKATIKNGELTVVCSLNELDSDGMPPLSSTKKNHLVVFEKDAATGCVLAGKTVTINVGAMIESDVSTEEIVAIAKRKKELKAALAAL